MLCHILCVSFLYVCFFSFFSLYLFLLSRLTASNYTQKQQFLWTEDCIVDIDCRLLGSRSLHLNRTNETYFILYLTFTIYIITSHRFWSNQIFMSYCILYIAFLIINLLCICCFQYFAFCSQCVYDVNLCESTIR